MEGCRDVGMEGWRDVGLSLSLSLYFIDSATISKLLNLWLIPVYVHYPPSQYLMQRPKAHLLLIQRFH